MIKRTASVLAAISMAGGIAPAQTRFTTIYDIAAGRPNGLALLNGALLGVVWDTGCGYVFQMAPPTAPGGAWDRSVLYTFASSGDGCGPQWAPQPGAGGVLYGLTEAGGQNDYGTMYQLEQPASPGGAWTENLAYSFNATWEEGGGNPLSPLVAGPAGSFYVIGSFNGGVLVQLLPPSGPPFPWTGAQLAEITGGNWVVTGPHGELYTTEANGGIYGGGIVVELAPPVAPGGAWTQTTLYSFGCCSQAAPGDPSTLTLADEGTIYGTTYGEVPLTYSGMSAAFSLTPPSSPGGEWTYTMLHFFGENHANGPLVLHDGNLYGTVQNPRGGAVFELQPSSGAGGSWTINYLHSFTNGQIPSGQLVIDKSGAIYGMTGSLNDPPTGTIFKIEMK